MKNKRFDIYGILILLVIAVLYNVLYFLIPFNRTYSNISFWITYGLTMAMLIMTGFVAYISFNKEKLKSRIFGISIFKAILIADIIQLVLNIVVMSVGNFYEIPYWIIIVIEVLIVCYSLISLIVKTAYREKIDEIDDKTINKTSFIEELRVQSQLLMPLAKNKSYYQSLSKMIDVIKYCNPISNEQVIDLEDEILNNIYKLRDFIISDNDINAEKTIQVIVNQMEERKLRSKK